MGRFQIGLGLLILLLILGIGSCYAMQEAQAPIAQTMEQAALHARRGDMGNAASAAARAEQAWQRARTITASLADHMPLEDIESLFAQLDAYEHDDPAAYSALCAELARRIRAVAEAQELTVSAFF